MRAQVGGAYRRNGKVKIESPEGHVRFDGDGEGGAKRIAAAFRYPWEEREAE